MIAGFAVMVALIAIVNVQRYFRDRDGRWHEHRTNYRMRRLLPNGEWEYREMSAEEEGKRWEDSII